MQAMQHLMQNLHRPASLQEALSRVDDTMLIVQVVMQLPCGPPMDVWSLGCILAEMVLHQPLFPANSTAELIARVTFLPCTGQALQHSFAASLSTKAVTLA